MSISNLFKKKKDEITDEEVLKYSSNNYIIKENYKSKDYLLKYLKECNKFLKISKIDDNDIDLEKKYRCYTMSIKSLFDKINVLYVLGSEFDVIKKYVEEYRILMEKLSKTQEKLYRLKEKLPYNYITDLLSLAYLYNLDFNKLEFIKNVMIDEKYVDAVLDVIRNKIFNNEIKNTKDFYFKEKGFFREYIKSDDGLMNVLNSNNIDEKNKEFKKYLDGIKTKHYDSLLKYHEKLGDDKHIYYTSFDFRLTALAKILEIDKDILKNSKFIAFDLL